MLEACVHEGSGERKTLHHDMAQHLKYPKEIPHLKGTAHCCQNRIL